MILKKKQFHFKGFTIPEIELNKGEMIRFWVQKPPTEKSKEIWNLKLIAELVQYFSLSVKVKLCPNRVKLGLWDFLKPKTILKYLNKTYSLNEKEALLLISYFDFSPNWKIKNLGHNDGLLFSILCQFQKENFVIFHYYVLSPESEIQLTKFVKSELLKGKSAIGFDDLNFKTKVIDSENIINLDLIRS